MPIGRPTGSAHGDGFRPLANKHACATMRAKLSIVCRCESGRVCKAAIDTAAWLQFCLNRANLIQAPEGLRSGTSEEIPHLLVYKQKVAAPKRTATLVL